MSIFGKQSPKIKNSSGTDIDLDYAVVERDEPIFENLMQPSELDGSRVFNNREYGWYYEVVINLWMYGNDAARLAKYNTLNSNLYDLVTLYRHRDNEPVKDSSGDEVPFCFLEMIPYYVNNPPDGSNEPGDALILRFESTKNIKLESSAVEPPPGGDAILITPDKKAIKTPDGKVIKIP